MWTHPGQCYTTQYTSSSLITVAEILLIIVFFVMGTMPFFFSAKENKIPPPRQILSLAFQPLQSAIGNTPSKVTREKTSLVPACSSATTQPVSVETFSGLRLRSAAQLWTLSGDNPSSNGRENTMYICGLTMSGESLVIRGCNTKPQQWLVDQ